MSMFDTYLSQSSYSGSSAHYDEHTERWVDEGDQPFGYSGHCEVHTDEA